MEDHKISRVVVLGGGTAGWMTASYLGRALGPQVTITVLEAPAVPRIGVGEATVPNLQKAFFDFLGLSEEEWMRECNASYKMGITFINWRTPGLGNASARAFKESVDHYYHLFGLLPNHDSLPLSHYWIYLKLSGQAVEPFDYACYREPPIMDACLAPRFADGTRWTNYAWHFDANLVADFLRRFAVSKQGAVHIEDEMTDAVIDERGFISALRTRAGWIITGDMFVVGGLFRPPHRRLAQRLLIWLS